MCKASYMPMSMRFAVSLAIALCLALLSCIYIFDISALFKIYVKNSNSTGEQEKGGFGPEPDEPIFCDRNHFYYDICHLNRPTILDPTTATFYTAANSRADPMVGQAVANSTHVVTEKIQPHPRILNTPVHLVRELTLTTSRPSFPCTVAHSAPALILSAGGWTGNFWHDITDRFIPLYITMEAFFPNRDFVIGIFDYDDRWGRRYVPLLSAYTRRHIIGLDRETAAHCFPSAIVGLVSHGPTAVDPTLQRGPRPKTIRDFSAFFKAAYARKNQNTTLPLPWKSEGRPRLLIVNRDGPRSILNVDQVREEAEQIGFEVAIFVPSHRTTLHDAYRLVDSSHALIGVHGAALSNILFLRPGSVFMQIVPPKCGWLGDLCFGKMATRLGLEYMIYDVGEDESILKLDKKTRDWVATRVTQIEIWAVYRDQILKLDIVRFKRCLKRAYKKAALFMRKQNSGVL